MENMQDEGFDPHVMTWEQEVEKEMWLERDQSHHEDLLGQGDGGFISYDDFPPLPDFPCISSSSSSSSSSCSSAPHAPTDLVSSKPINYSSATCSSSTTTSSSKSSSSSSASSWARAKSSLGGSDQVDTNQRSHQEGAELQGLLQVDSMDSDCMHVMEELGDMDLDDIWDPSCIFPYEEDHQGLILGGEEDQGNQFWMGGGDGLVQGDDDQGVPSEDLATVFFEWLKSNKESISADDLRSIKLKRSTIECAAKRLGGGKEGMKQLLKLILEWVQNHQLQKKKNSADGVFLDCTTIATTTTTTPVPAVAAIVANPNPSAPLENTQPQPQTQFQHTNPPTPLQPDSMTNPYSFMPQMQQWSPFSTVIGGYNMGDGGGVGGGYSQPDYQTWVHPPPTQQTHFTMPGHPPYMNAYQYHHPVPIPLAPVPPPTFNQYPYPVYPNHAENRLMMRLGSSATKEARKKRMARQKRLFSHSRNHYNNQHQVGTEQQARLVNDTDCTNTEQGNWVFWYPTPNVVASPMLMSEAPPAPPPPPQSPPPPSPPPTTKPQQRRATSEKRQTSKTTSGNEKNLKFLLQKVLKQSDVGNLGRIVLPKKEAETYLPQLEARDGISIAMEDIGTSRVWNMRYRFWPNNKSRMYLLENTGDFVRSNGLQEGDFIVIYSDIKCGKYLIRGVKVRQSGSKMEVRKQGKITQRYLQAKNSTGIGGSSMRETRVMI